MAENRDLLIVEDDPGIQRQLRWCFDDYRVTIADGRESALEAIGRHRFPVVTLDLGLPPDPDDASEGLKALEEILDLAPRTKVIVVSGNDDRENAMRAVALGAYDFYRKPIDVEELNLIVDRAWELYSLEESYREMQKAAAGKALDAIVTASSRMLALNRMIEKVAPSDVTVLIRGESGTGKELVARAIHQLSPRRDRKLVAINCAAIPDTLLESELFGYEKGAFTGALQRKIGRVEDASGGTLFLDEIGDIPQGLQAKLLRFIQERVIQRLGGNKEISVDVRIVCATHQDLDRKIADGSFREDLYYRIGEITIDLPPLRERQGDRILLAKYFFDKYRREFKSECKGFSEAAIRLIEDYAWPGNVRELESCIKRAVIMAEGELIEAGDLGLKVDEVPEETGGMTLAEVRGRAERSAILRSLAVHGNNVTQAAKMLGVTRQTLYNLLEKYEIR